MSECKKMLLELRSEVARRKGYLGDYDDIVSVARREAFEDVITYIDLMIDEMEL